MKRAADICAICVAIAAVFAASDRGIDRARATSVTTSNPRPTTVASSQGPCSLVRRESAAESWKGINAGNAMIGADHEKLSGIGEQAVFGPRDRLYVLSGDAFLAIEAGFDNAVRERAKKVAALVLSKLR